MKINNILATRSRVIYLGRRPYRAALILSNLLLILLDPLQKSFYNRLPLFKESQRRPYSPNVIDIRKQLIVAILVIAYM